MSIKTLSNSPLGARVRFSQKRGSPNPAGNYEAAPTHTKRLQINVQKANVNLFPFGYSQSSNGHSPVPQKRAATMRKLPSTVPQLPDK